MKELYKYIPISSIENNYILGGSGDITWGYELFLPDIFNKNSDEATKFHLDLINLFLDLPVKTSVHFQSFVYSEEYNNPLTGTETFTVKHDKVRFLGNNIQKCRTFLYITIPSTKKANLTGAIDYILKKPFDDLDTVLRIAKSLTDSFTNNLNSKSSVGISAKRLSDQELHRNILAAAKGEPNLNENLVPDDFFPKLKEDGEFYCKSGNDYVSVICQKDDGFTSSITCNPVSLDFEDVKEFEGKSIQFNNPLAFSYPLTLGLQFSHIYNFIFIIEDIENITHEINKNNGYYNFLAALKYAPAKEKMQKIQEFIDFCTKGNETPVRFTSNIVVKDSNKDKLRKMENLVSQTYLNLNASIAKPSWVNTFDKLMRSIPSLGRYQDDLLISYLYSIACYIPKENHYTSDKSGYLFQDRFGNPVLVDLVSNKLQTNSNFVVFGPSGSGKSFIMNSIVSQTLSSGDIVVIIDVGASYKRIGNINHAYYVDTTDISTISFNIFDCRRDMSGKYNYLDEGAFQVVFIQNILNYLWYCGKEIDPEKENINNAFLNSLIVQFYEHLNSHQLNGTFDLFFEFIDTFFQEEANNKFLEFVNKNQFKLVLENFTSLNNGTYKNILNASYSEEIKSNFIIYDLKGLEKDPFLKDLVFLMILNRVIHKFDTQKDKRKLLFIDEAIDSLKGNSGEFIGGMYRKIRKQNGRVGIATQGITYLDEINSLVRQSIFSNSDVKILLSHKSNTQDYPILKKYLALSDHSIELLDKLQQNDAELWREVFIQIGAYPRVFRYSVSEITSLAYSTTPKDIIEIDNEFKKTDNYEAAIYNVLDKRNELA